MATEEQIRELAYRLWEEEGRPEGKDQEHYFKARKILEDKEAMPVIQLPSSLAKKAVATIAKTTARRRKKQ